MSLPIQSREEVGVLPRLPYPDGDRFILACPCCGSGEYLTNWDGNRNDYCGQCGQKIDWGEEEMKDGMDS